MTEQNSKAAPAGTFVRDDGPAMSRPQKRSSLVAAAMLLAAGIFTLKSFLPALIWAVIFAIGLWPLFKRATIHMPGHRRELLALAFLLGVLLVFVVPLLIIAVPLVGDTHAAGQWIAQAKVNGIPAPVFLGSLPFGDRLLPLWQRELGQPGQIGAIAGHAVQNSAFRTARAIGSGALHRLVLLGFMLLALFYLLRDGEDVAAELAVGSRRVFGPAGEDVGRQVIRSVHGTVNGLVLVGLGEGVILGLAYAVAGVPHATLFGLLTALLAMVPFGAPLVFLTAALVLAGSGKLITAAVIVGLGFLVSFAADHFIRPVLIGGATRLPFPLGAARDPGRRRELGPGRPVHGTGDYGGASAALARVGRNTTRPTQSAYRDSPTDPINPPGGVTRAMLDPAISGPTVESIS